MDFPGADAAHGRAIALPGVSSIALVRASAFSAMIGRAAMATQLEARSVALDPLHPRVAAFSFEIKTTNRAYAEALADLAELENTNTLPPTARSIAARAQLFGGEPSKALAYTAVMDQFNRPYWEAIIHAKLGDRVASDRALAALQAIDDGRSGYQFATIHAMRGERDLSLKHLEQAFKARDPGLIGLRVDPALDPIRNDPRFVAIEKALRFPPV